MRSLKPLRKFNRSAPCFVWRPTRETFAGMKDCQRYLSETLGIFRVFLGHHRCSVFLNTEPLTQIILISKHHYQNYLYHKPKRNFYITRRGNVEKRTLL